MDLIETKTWLKSRLSEEKYLHSLGAEEMARELAIIFSADEETAAYAALIHDNAKNMPYEEMLKLIETDKIEIEDCIKNNSKILHSYIGSYIAQKELGVTDQNILDAVKFHTTGKPDMNLLEKIIYLSDKIEANTRDLDFRDKVLNIIKETNNIDKAILFCIDNTIKSLLDRHLPINFLTIEVWNNYLSKCQTV